MVIYRPNKFKRIVFLFVTVFWLLSGYKPVLAFNAPEQKLTSYVVKLKPQAQLTELSPLATNLKKRFEFSLQPEFQNIYTFNSSLNLYELQSLLSGEFTYLQPISDVSKADVQVNDPGFTNSADDTEKQWGLVKTGFLQAWQTTTGSYSNMVAVIDTGIDETHEDLQNIRFVPGYDFVGKQSIATGVNSDDNGHGTLVAGVLGATANNFKGVVGTNWAISIMPLKVLDQSGKGDAVDVSEAIVWATDHSAQFINLSIGGIGFGHDTALSNAIDYAFKKNVFIAAAAGNDTSVKGSDLDSEPVYPICDDNGANMVIGVTATDNKDIKPDFANYGSNCVDVSAPGKRILSTINYDPLTKKYSPNSYAFASGSSLAVPFVVGQAALIKSLYPYATNIQIRKNIISTTDNIDALNPAGCGGSSCAGLLGSGRINVKKSLDKPINFQTLNEGDLVFVNATGKKYKILGGQKRLISDLVYQQSFLSSSFKFVNDIGQMEDFPAGPYLTPQDNTLIRLKNSNSIFLMKNGEKLPVTDFVFKQRGFNFGEVKEVGFDEFNSWQTGNFYSPVEGTLLKTPKNPTVYWVAGQVLHPVSKVYYNVRGLKIFPLVTISEEELKGYSKGESYFF